MTLQLPDVNTLVRVDVVGDGAGHPSRVEDRDGQRLLLAAPRYGGDLAAPQPGDLLAIRWTNLRGVCVAPAEFVAGQRRPMPLWEVQAVGTVEIEQRRRYARAPASDPVAIVRRPPAEVALTAVVGGQLVDIGEGGMRCRLAGAAPEPGEDLQVRLDLDGEQVEVTGQVLRCFTVGDAVEAVVAFEEPVRCADAIRRYVLRQQVRARRTARG